MLIQTQIILIIIFLILSAFFSASESSLLSISRFKVRNMVERKKLGAAYVKKLKDDPERLLSTILIGNNVVTIAASAMATSIAISLHKSNAVAISTGLMTFLILIFAEITPKSLATRNNEAFSLFSAPAIWFISVAIYPVIKMLDHFLKGVNKLVGTKKIPIITEEELKTIVKASGEEGTIKEIEKKMIQRIFDFDNTTVSDIMTSKKNMVCISSDMQIKDVLHVPTSKSYSRFPVYEKNKDNIIGILYLKDMLKFVKDGKLDVAAIHVMRKPFFVFANKKIDKMLHLFQDRKQHMAIVIDEKAQILGLVTIENILEEIVGEIIDESDKINPSVMHVSKNEWIARGSSEIEEVNAKTGMAIKSSDYVDLDSFIIATLGRPPKFNEEVNYQSFRIIMEDVQGKKVLRARIVKV